MCTWSSKSFVVSLVGMSTNAEIGIRIFAYDIRIYLNILMIYTSLSNRPIYDGLLGGACIENMRYMYMHGIVCGQYQWRNHGKKINKFCTVS